MTKIYHKNLLKICITLLLVVCSLHLPKINEFCLRIQMLPAKMQVGLTSWPTPYLRNQLI